MSRKLQCNHQRLLRSSGPIYIAELLSGDTGKNPLDQVGPFFSMPWRQLSQHQHISFDIDHKIHQYCSTQFFFILIFLLVQVITYFAIPSFEEMLVFSNIAHLHSHSIYHADNNIFNQNTCKKHVTRKEKLISKNPGSMIQTKPYNTLSFTMLSTLQDTLRKGLV